MLRFSGARQALRIGSDFMWHGYFGFVATLLAVINGLIAIAVALLPMRRSVLKLRLGAAALVLSALAVGATFYSVYRGHVQFERQQAGRAETRARLDQFIAEGRRLLGHIKDGNRELPTAAADQWAQRVELFLRDRQGEAAIPRFRKDANELYGDDSGVAAPRLAYWRAVRNRLVNLEVIAAEFSEDPGR
jgi:hypothetical protein